MIPYILTNDSLTVIIDGKSLTMNRDNPSFRSATQALQDEDYEKVEQMFDIPKAVPTKANKCIIIAWIKSCNL